MIGADDDDDDDHDDDKKESRRDLNEVEMELDEVSRWAALHTVNKSEKGNHYEKQTNIWTVKINLQRRRMRTT